MMGNMALPILTIGFILAAEPSALRRMIRTSLFVCTSSLGEVAPMKIARTLRWHNAKCQLLDGPLNAISTRFSQVR